MYWFEVIKEILQDPTILAKNIYNINKTRMILSMLSFVKVLVSKYNKRDYKSTRVKCIFITIIECINNDSRYLNLIII